MCIRDSVCAIIGGIANSFLDTGIYPAVSEIIYKAPGVATMGIKFFIAIAQMLLPFVLGVAVTSTAAGLTSYLSLIHISLRELDFPCTKVIIAQRISTTKTADKIIVLQNGYIKEMGTHEELMEKKGYYYELVKLQTGVDEL